MTAVLAACGGGGGGGDASNDTSTITRVNTPAPAPAPAPIPAPAPEPAPEPAPAPAPSTGGDDANAGASAVSNADTVGRARALSALSNLAVDGVLETPPTAAATATGTGRSYFVDSRAGNDSNDGLASTVSGTRGPWRTLARLSTK